MNPHDPDNPKNSINRGTPTIFDNITITKDNFNDVVRYKKESHGHTMVFCESEIPEIISKMNSNYLYKRWFINTSEYTLMDMYNHCFKDEELIYYLQRRIMNLDLPHNKINDVFFYDFSPDKLAEEYEPAEENEWYFFTPRDKRCKDDDKWDPLRVVHSDESPGRWRGALGNSMEIHHEGQLIGHKQPLIFYKGDWKIRETPTMTYWVMHEFTIDQTSARKINWSMHEFKPNNGSTKRHDVDYIRMDWVVCRMYNKNYKSLIGKVQLPKSHKANKNSSDHHQQKCYASLKKSAIDGQMCSNAFPNMDGGGATPIGTKDPYWNKSDEIMGSNAFLNMDGGGATPIVTDDSDWDRGDEIVCSSAFPNMDGGDTIQTEDQDWDKCDEFVCSSAFPNMDGEGATPIGTEDLDWDKGDDKIVCSSAFPNVDGGGATPIGTEDPDWDKCDEIVCSSAFPNTDGGGTPIGTEDSDWDKGDEIMCNSTFPNMDGEGVTSIGTEDSDWNRGDEIMNNRLPRLPQLAYIFPNMSKIGMQVMQYGDNSSSGYSQGESSDDEQSLNYLLSILNFDNLVASDDNSSNDNEPLSHQMEGID